MKEEQKSPKIKLKVRQIEETESNEAFDEQKQVSQTEIQQEIGQTDGSQPVQKIIIHDQRQKDEEKEENTAENAKKHSVFRITAIVLTILLVIAIIVEVAVMIWLKSGTDDLKNKNDKIPQTESSISVSI